MRRGALNNMRLLAGLLALVLAGPVAAQGFSVEPLDPVDPADPLDPVDPVDPQQGQSSAEFGLDANPDMGPDTGIVQAPNADYGFVTSPQSDIGLFPSDNAEIGMVQTRNMSASSNVTAVSAATAPAAELRALDRTVGQTTDFEMAVGETVVIGRLAIQLAECRYPVDNPASDAFAHLMIADLDGRQLFDGWMVASSPALMALEHPRYDVWVLNCRTS